MYLVATVVTVTVHGCPRLYMDTNINHAAELMCITSLDIRHILLPIKTLAC